MSDSSNEAETLDTGTEELLCALKNRVATITLNRPEKRNALSDNLTPALRSMLLHLDTRSDVGCVVITGAGTAFCAGGDVSGMGSNRSDAQLSNPVAESAPPSREDQIRELQVKQATLTLRLHELSKPTIVALPGAAAGAGLSIALACDIRIAAESAFITTAFRNVGLSGDYGCSWFMTRLAGPAMAKELFLSSRRVSATECVSLGLVNRVVPFDELASQARACGTDRSRSRARPAIYERESESRTNSRSQDLPGSRGRSIGAIVEFS